jgi:DNA-binding GntR family transcriptional regulator
MKPRNDRNEMPKPLYGPTVEYADGTVVPGQPLDVEQILDTFERSDAEARRACLCIFAHDLTVAIRAIIFDRPVSDADLDRVQDINESLHQLTSCANPRKEWSAHDQALLLRAIVDSSFEHGLDRWIGHALALAAGSMMRSTTAKRAADTG